jgi:Spy/CpxP family protein refolding chaperone
MKWLNLSILTIVAVIFTSRVTTTQSFASNPSLTAQQPAEESSNKERVTLDSRLNRVLLQLDLTPEQLTQIRNISDKYRRDNMTLRKELSQNRQQLNTMLGSDASSEELQAQHTKVENLSSQLSNNQFTTLLETREVLTAEQKAKLAELMKQGGHHRRQQE